MNADEEACLRSLSFTEIYARESIIEPAVHDTGNWLLESQNFQDWIQRKRLDEHRGFFWIQGNPGSGKSTLMKKMYTHVKACRQDPLSVTAAFFFNARGSMIEKSPTGLFRTLLHKMCQQISALRDLVVKQYVAKRRLLTPDWQWQLSELKEFLATAVTPSVIGQRSLLLFVDALDECDFDATQSVIQIFEALASSSFSNKTDISICLSSRYWPQFRIQNCFIARVELENKGDIDRYIRKHLESRQINEDAELHAVLRTEMLDKAKGTFLWVVLVTKDLLQARTAGATLRELRKIVEMVPKDLNEFYQHLLQSTMGEGSERMLRLLQLVYYAERPLSPTEVGYALAFGCRAYPSYAEWSQSSEYVRSDDQMEKRIREHSKGLVEIAGVDSFPRRTVVQFIHQSVNNFLTADGFSFLRDSRQQTHDGDGHEFIKTACLNYLGTEELETLPLVDLKVDGQFDDGLRSQVADQPFLEYMVQYIFPHAAQAEKKGISQDRFRIYICSNRGGFERWRCLYDAIFDGLFGHRQQGPQTRPIHILSQYGLLTRDIAEKERNIDIAGGAYGSALVAACCFGHSDAVRILLEYGADPRIEDNSKDNARTPLAHAVTHAIHKQHLSVLRVLLNDQRSSFTLQERLNSLSCMNFPDPSSSWKESDSGVSSREEMSQTDNTRAVLALLLPEPFFPDSAIHDLFKAVSFGPARVLPYLLDKVDDSIIHDEELWLELLEGFPTDIASKLRTLLDRGGRVKITRLMLDFSRTGNDPKDGGEILSLLLENCELETTEDFVESISVYEHSSQIIRNLEASGRRFDPFTPSQLLTALQFGSAETAAFFLQRQDGNATADEMLDSALGNGYHGEEVTRLLLGFHHPDCINEQAVMTVVGNFKSGGDLLRLLHSRGSSLKFSEAALVLAVSKQDADAVKFILEHFECVRITEKILTTATTGQHYKTAEYCRLLLNYGPGLSIPESAIIGAICDSRAAVSVLEVFCEHEKPLVCTQNVMAAAAKSEEGPNALEFILQQDRTAEISSSMIKTAMGAEHAAALISVMLHHDHTTVIDEEHLIAAASNPWDPSTIFELLQTKDKLSNADSETEILSTGPAKRRRISHRWPPRISANVIKAAFANPVEGAKLQLLELFVEWGIITATDLANGMSNAHARSPTSFYIPPISQLFPGIWIFLSRWTADSKPNLAYSVISRHLITPSKPRAPPDMPL